MHPDLRRREALRIHRLRVAGAALTGLVITAYWAGRSAGLW